MYRHLQRAIMLLATPLPLGGPASAQDIASRKLGPDTMLRRLISLMAAALLACAIVSGQTVTEENLLNLKKSNAPDELIIKAISMAKKIDVDTSFENTVRLMGKGISQAIVDTLVQRKAALEPQVTNSAPATAMPPLESPPRSSPPTPASTCPQGDGAYFLTASGWKKMEQAPLQEMSQNLTRATNPFGRKTMGYKLDGPEAPVKVGLLPEFCVVGSSETATRSIMVVKLTKNRNNRELTTTSSGVFRRTKIGEYDRLDNVKVERKSDREIMVNLPGELKPGEYGLMIHTGLIYDFSARESDSPGRN